MEMSSHIKPWTLYFREITPVPTEEDDGWTSEPVRTIWNEERSLVPYVQSLPWRSATVRACFEGTMSGQSPQTPGWRNADPTTVFRRKLSALYALKWVAKRKYDDTEWSLGAFANLREATFSFVMSVRPSTWNNSAPMGWIFMTLNIWVFFKNLSREFKFG